MGHNPTSTEREGNKTHRRMVADLQKLIEASATLNDWFSCSVCYCVCNCRSECVQMPFHNCSLHLAEIVLWS